MKRHICNPFLRGKRLLALIFVTISVISSISGTAVPAMASFTGDEAFSDISWDFIMKDSLAYPRSGGIQAFCVTDEYLIIIENTAKTETIPDVVSAYYRYDHDAAGNPVEQYSLAKRVENFDYEHANGMTWNPNTDEILVAPYFNNGQKSRGCVFVMNPHTLEYVETRKILPGHLIRAIDYDPGADRYAVLATKGSKKKLVIMDSRFKVIETHAAPDNSPGTYYQDICLRGDYILTPPCTIGMGIGDFVNIHSLSRDSKLFTVPLDISLGKNERIEGEAICETEPGIFLMAVNLFKKDNSRELRIYRSTVPYYFTISVSIANGSATLASERVLRGEDYTIGYEPYPGFQLTSILVDGKNVDYEAFADNYTFSNIQEDHTININYTAPGSGQAAPAAPIPTGSVEQVLSERPQKASDTDAATITPNPDALITADSAAARAADEMPAVIDALLTIGEAADMLVHDPGALLLRLAEGASSAVRRAATGLLQARIPFILLGTGVIFCFVYISHVRTERKRRHNAALRKRRFLQAKIAEAEQELIETEMSLSYLI